MAFSGFRYLIFKNTFRNSFSQFYQYGSFCKTKQFPSDIHKRISLSKSLQLRFICLSSCVMDMSKITITFIKPDGTKIQATSDVGKTVMDLVKDRDIGSEGFGACSGTLSCSTCHVIFESDKWNLKPPHDEEMDMLQFAPSLTDKSRLGCQITLTKDMDGMEIHLPEEILDMRGNQD